MRVIETAARTRATPGWLAALAALVGVGVAAAAEPRRPNVVIVMTDDQGSGDFSFAGNPVLQTPRFDAFAREAVRLVDFHCAPMCTPTRGQLLTGLAALRNGATSVTAGRTFLRPGIPTLAERFAASGYATGVFGKWHLGDSYPHRPHDKGFGESLYHLGWGQWHSTPECGWPLIDGRAFRNGVQEPFRGHCTDVWFDAAIGWIKAQKEAGRPFLCYLPTNAPHGPHVELAEYLEPYRRPGLPTGFFGMIAHVDARFGDLERFLVDEGLRDDTIVIVTTDNGGTAGTKIFNAGLRGGKTQAYEGGHRVPCWIRWPNGGLGAPRDVAEPTQNTDLLPTLCDLCGVPPPAWPAADVPYAGVSLAALVRGRVASLPERTFVVQYGQTPKKFDACVVRGRWRLVAGRELFDVAADRSQAHDVAGEHPAVVARLRADYESWWAGVEPTLGAFVPQSLGAVEQPVVELTSGDWTDIYADNIWLVRQAVGGPQGGVWHLDVARPGTYEFVLRRWPPKFDAPLGGDCALPFDSPGPKQNGKPATYPRIARAHVAIAGVAAAVAADPRDSTATVRVELPAGRATLQAWFADDADEPLCGAFFATARRLDGGPKAPAD